MGKLLSLLFLCRDLAHKEHLRTKSYANHMALNEFYEEIVELADGLAEAYQGKHGLIDDIPAMTNAPSGDIVTVLRNQVKWIESNRYKVCKEDDAALQALLDPIITLFYSTIYKLEHLG
jgi:hypothetical protein